MDIPFPSITSTDPVPLAPWRLSPPRFVYVCYCCGVVDSQQKRILLFWIWANIFDCQKFPSSLRRLMCIPAFLMWTMGPPVLCSEQQATPSLLGCIWNRSLDLCPLFKKGFAVPLVHVGVSTIPSSSNQSCVSGPVTS